VQLDVQRPAVLVLVLLDKEDHQEGDDCGAGVHHQLPDFRKPCPRAGDRPQYDQCDSHAKSDRRPGGARPRGSEVVEHAGRRRLRPRLPGLRPGLSSGRPAAATFELAATSTRLHDCSRTGDALAYPWLSRRLGQSPIARAASSAVTPSPWYLRPRSIVAWKNPALLPQS